MTDLAARLGHTFVDPGLLIEAVTHRSWCAENADTPSNERLEFLGDAVLGLVIADHLFQLEGSMAEGELAMARAAVVSTEALAQFATVIDLGGVLRRGTGEASTTTSRCRSLRLKTGSSWPLGWTCGARADMLWPRRQPTRRA